MPLSLFFSDFIALMVQIYSDAVTTLTHTDAGNVRVSNENVLDLNVSLCSKVS